MHLDSPCHHLLGRHIGLYSVQQPPAIAVAILHINKHGYRKRDIRGESGPGQGRFAVFMGGGSVADLRLLACGGGRQAPAFAVSILFMIKHE